VIPRKEASGESLNRQYAVQQILFHPFGIGFLIIILLSADRTALFVTFGLLEALEAFKASFVEDVRAAEDGLFLQAKVLIANRARLLLIEPLERLFLDLPPLVLAQGQLRLVNQSESLCKTQLLNIVYSLPLDVMICDLIPLSVILKHL
jgi:hypothetical protein